MFEPAPAPVPGPLCAECGAWAGDGTKMALSNESPYPSPDPYKPAFVPAYLPPKKNVDAIAEACVRICIPLATETLSLRLILYSILCATVNIYIRYRYPTTPPPFLLHISIGSRRTTAAE
ncbi:hypothetical protein AZE42_04736 [Rhizopogon vesiculosus]|uniref:Uncharacterized protein n=1 Tax=Rhizopogon vesiculosus TaxID=180088 RepID=A0A1J8QF66_9AGAM|nr:hypothetical protein AZE42_04736 [Rhizopogon vesiculosus]